MTIRSEGRSVISDRWSVNGIEEYDGDKECNHKSGCHNTADWNIELIDRYGGRGERRACDEHLKKPASGSQNE